MANIKAVEIFTPSDFPQHTYVIRDDQQLENRLRDALATPGEIVSISGPSKSGKTVLAEKVVGRDNLITITGASITDPDHLWNRVLDWMDAPTSNTTSNMHGQAGQVSGKAGGELSVPLVAKGAVEVGAQLELSHQKTVSSETSRTGMMQVVKEIADSEFVLLIDDFHYMKREVQSEVAKQIKEAARRHVKICTASVPHRSDDVVRSNPELRGRVRAIDSSYWKVSELEEIAKEGFPRLGRELSSVAVRKLATEASGSPQLMQALCLQTCFEIKLLESQYPDSTASREEILLSDEQLKQIMEECSTRTDFSSLIRNMHAGPRTRGNERKEFVFNDGSRGDVYRCLLLAMASDPPKLSYMYNELAKSIQGVCVAEVPQSPSIYQACSQIARMALDMYPDQRVFEWDEDNSQLDIVDPYFLFYIRWSGKLKVLGKQSTT